MQLSSCTFFLSTKKFCYLSEKLGIMGMSGQLCKNDRHAMRRSKKCKSVIPRVINAAEKAFSSISISSHHLQKDPKATTIISTTLSCLFHLCKKLAYFASPPCIVISIKEGQKIPSYIVARNHQRIFRFPGNPLGEFWVSTSRVL